MSCEINLYEARLRPKQELATGRNLAVTSLLALVLIGIWAWLAHSEDKQRRGDGSRKAGGGCQ